MTTKCLLVHDQAVQVIPETIEIIFGRGCCDNMLYFETYEDIDIECCYHRNTSYENDLKITGWVISLDYIH